jgi:predicted sugar kinase
MLIYPSEEFQISGACAHIGQKYYLEYQNIVKTSVTGSIEIELATPRFMGLGSELLIGLTIEQGLYWLNNKHVIGNQNWSKNRSYNAVDSLTTYSFQYGGINITNLNTHKSCVPELIYRSEMNENQQDKKMFVSLFLPRVNSTISDDFEEERILNFLSTLSSVKSLSNFLDGNNLIQALLDNDFGKFASQLMKIIYQNYQASISSGKGIPYSEEEKMIFNEMKANGALAYGRSATGLGLFSISLGEDTSNEITSAIRKKTGFNRGTTLNTMIENQGWSYKVYNDDVKYAKHLIFNMKQGLLSEKMLRGKL